MFSSAALSKIKGHCSKPAETGNKTTINRSQVHVVEVSKVLGKSEVKMLNSRTMLEKLQLGKTEAITDYRGLKWRTLLYLQVNKCSWIQNDNETDCWVFYDVNTIYLIQGETPNKKGTHFIFYFYFFTLFCKMLNAINKQMQVYPKAKNCKGVAKSYN